MVYIDLIFQYGFILCLLTLSCHRVNQPFQASCSTCDMRYARNMRLVDHATRLAPTVIMGIMVCVCVCVLWGSEDAHDNRLCAGPWCISTSSFITASSCVY